MFFFEKKNQKTFVCSGTRVASVSDQRGKSFLVLFFKKEHLSLSPPSSRTPPARGQSAHGRSLSVLPGLRRLA
jgi:hypothetical protein